MTKHTSIWFHPNFRRMTDRFPAVITSHQLQLGFLMGSTDDFRWSKQSSTIWLWHSQFAMERSTIFKNGKPSISMGHLYHGYVTNNQRVDQHDQHIFQWSTQLGDCQKKIEICTVYFFSVTYHFYDLYVPLSLIHEQCSKPLCFILLVKNGIPRALGLWNNHQYMKASFDPQTNHNARSWSQPLLDISARVGSQENLLGKTPMILMVKTLVSGQDFPSKTNPIKLGQHLIVL